jgi:hypothetical protein
MYDFPANPATGTVVLGPGGAYYTYDGTKWVVKTSTPTGVGCYMGDTPPASPVAGEFWFDTAGVMLYIYEYDGTSYQWVAAANAQGVPPANTAPLMDGTAAIGASGNYARQDHVHPSDTSRAPLAGTTGQAFTVGNASATTQALARGQALQVAPVAAATATNGTTGPVGVTTGTLTAPCNGMAIVYFSVSIPGLTGGLASFSQTASLAGLNMLSPAMSNYPQNHGFGYLPMTAGQSSTFTVSASTSAAQNIGVQASAFFVPSP